MLLILPSTQLPSTNQTGEIRQHTIVSGLLMLVTSPKVHAIRFWSCYSAEPISLSLTPIKMVSYRSVLKICSSFRTWWRLIYWKDTGTIENFNFSWIPHNHRQGGFLKRSWQDCSVKNERWTDFYYSLLLLR